MSDRKALIFSQVTDQNCLKLALHDKHRAGAKANRSKTLHSLDDIQMAISTTNQRKGNGRCFEYLRQQIKIKPATSAVSINGIKNNLAGTHVAQHPRRFLNLDTYKVFTIVKKDIVLIQLFVFSDVKHSHHTLWIPRDGQPLQKNIFLAHRDS